MHPKSENGDPLFRSARNSSWPSRVRSPTIRKSWSWTKRPPASTRKRRLLIRDALEKLLAGRTSIIIAHRLSTIQNADRIIVLHHGRIREIGTHQELLQAEGHLLEAVPAAVQGSARAGPPTHRAAASELTIYELRMTPLMIYDNQMGFHQRRQS